MDLLTSSSLSDLLDKALECPVCLEQLDDTARVLPCQHTFCRRCLLEIVHSRRELLCPECRVQCDLNVDDLPPNILLIRLLEGLKGNNRKQSTDRSDGQNVNELLQLGSQTSGVVGSQTTGLSINHSFNCKQQIISKSTPNSQPNQSQSPQTLQSAVPTPPQQISIKHSVPTPPLQTNQSPTQPQQTPPLLSPQQQSSVKQLVQTPNSLPGAKPLFNLDGKDLEDYVALYNYKPQKADEIELKKGDIYSVYKKCHDGWYKGLSVRNGTSGVFPGNYVQLVKSCVQMVQYGCPVSSTGTSQSRVVGQPIQQTASISKEPPIPKPKPSLPIKPSISLSSGVAHESSALTTSPQPNSATDAIVYARPRPSPAGQPMYDVSRTFSSLVPPPPPPQRPTRPLSSILVPNSKSNEDSAHQLAQAINQSLLISRPQSVSQSSLSDRASPVWHQPKVAATRNTVSMVANSSSMRPSGTAITPPPNVSVISSSSGITPTSHRPPLDRKESKSKEKSNFIKRFTSSSKPKRKPNSNSNNHNNSHNISNNSFSCDNPSFVDNSPNSLNHQTIHVRSGSCPNETFTDLGSHKKQNSLDDSNTVIKNRMAKTNTKESPPSDQQPIAPPLVRERFRCVVPYPPNSEYELELKVGDVVYVHKKREDGWYKGTLLRTGKTGLFPGPFVESF